MLPFHPLIPPLPSRGATLHRAVQHLCDGLFGLIPAASLPVFGSGNSAPLFCTELISSCTTRCPYDLLSFFLLPPAAWPLWHACTPSLERPASSAYPQACLARDFAGALASAASRVSLSMPLLFPQPLPMVADLLSTSMSTIKTIGKRPQMVANELTGGNCPGRDALLGSPPDPFPMA